MSSESKALTPSEEAEEAIRKSFMTPQTVDKHTVVREAFVDSRKAGVRSEYESIERAEAVQRLRAVGAALENYLGYYSPMSVIMDIQFNEIMVNYKRQGEKAIVDSIRGQEPEQSEEGFWRKWLGMRGKEI